jgi:hypothetical protein
MAQPLGGMRLPLAIPIRALHHLLFRRQLPPATTLAGRDEVLDLLCDVVGSLNQQELDPTGIKSNSARMAGATLRRRNVAHAL